MNTGRLLKYGGKTRTKRAEDRKTKETEDWRAREIKSEIEKAINLTKYAYNFGTARNLGMYCTLNM